MQLQAEDILIDGYSLSDLFPSCLERLKLSYEPLLSANLKDASNMYGLVEDLYFVDLCMLSASSETTLTSIEEDSTVDDLHPLGQSKIEYLPNPVAY